MISRFRYTCKQAFSQIGRNRAMSFTAILAITAMMLILGIFFVAFVNVDLFANEIQQDYNVVNVYMAEENDDATNEAIGEQLKAMDGVENIVYRNKDEALQIMKERWGENGYLLDNLRVNPLPNSYLVYVSDKDAASGINENAPEIEGVDDVKYYQDTVEKLAKITDFIQKGSIVVMIFLVIVSIIIVANTIKLTVFNRAKEISIMKYLGATDWFVRAPFIVEGIVIGTVASLVSSGIMFLMYSKLTEVIGPDIMRVLSVPVVSTNYLIGNLMVIFVALGVGIGTCGSIISIRRFLDK